MLKPSSFLVPSQNKFLPPSAGGSYVPAQAEAAAEPATHWAPRPHRLSPWERNGASHIQRVEMVLVAALCLYFASGVAAAWGLF